MFDFFYAMNIGHHQTSATDINSQLQRKIVRIHGMITPRHEIS